MKKIVEIIDTMQNEELAKVFDILASLPKSRESIIVLEEIMKRLEANDKPKVCAWLKQSQGPSLSNYFH